MFEWLAAAASSVVLGTSTPGMLQKFRERTKNRPVAVKQRIYASVDIQCVAAAVAAREAVISAGAGTFGNSVANAYSARGAALANAYSQTGGNGVIRDAVKKAWEDFKASVRSARKSWQTARDAAWSQFRSAVKGCKAASDVVDSGNATSEPSGD